MIHQLAVLCAALPLPQNPPPGFLQMQSTSGKDGKWSGKEFGPYRQPYGTYSKEGLPVSPGIYGYSGSHPDNGFWGKIKNPLSMEKKGTAPYMPFGPADNQLQAQNKEQDKGFVGNSLEDDAKFPGRIHPPFWWDQPPWWMKELPWWLSTPRTKMEGKFDTGQPTGVLGGGFKVDDEDSGQLENRLDSHIENINKSLEKRQGGRASTGPTGHGESLEREGKMAAKPSEKAFANQPNLEPHDANIPGRELPIPESRKAKSRFLEAYKDSPHRKVYNDQLRDTHMKGLKIVANVQPTVEEQNVEHDPSESDTISTSRSALNMKQPAPPPPILGVD